MPDKPAGAIKVQDHSPAFVKWIPLTLLGMTLMCVTSCAIINRRELGRQMRRKKSIYLFVAPSMIMLIGFCYYPIFSAFYHSLFNWEGGGQAVWLGLSNFREIFKDAVLRESTVNMIKLMLFGVLV